VGPDSRLHQRGDEGPRGACKECADENRRDRDGPRKARDFDPNESCSHSAQKQLPLRPDVEQTGPETVRNSQPGEDEGRRAKQRLTYLARSTERLKQG